MAAALARETDGKAQHLDWLGLTEISGPFLTLPVLEQHWPELDVLPRQQRERLRVEYAQWREDPSACRDGWVRHLLADVLEWDAALTWRDPGPGTPLERFDFTVREHEDTVVGPDFALVEPGSDLSAEPDTAAAAQRVRVLGTLLPAGCHPTRRLPEALGGAWSATPADRLARLLRAHRVSLGLVTDGRWWTLVWAPQGGVTTTATFDTIGWNEAAERNSVRAFRSLLCRARFFGVPDEETLVPLLEESGRNQEDVTDALGVQVRQAVELLVEAIGRADTAARRRGEQGLADRKVRAGEVYRGSVSVMMRVVFLLFAEERGLLPADNAVYAHAYSAGRLCAELEQRVQDEGEATLEYSSAAWHRLLALFHAVYGGVRHPDLELPAYDGSLFDPAAYWWLEGLPDPDAAAETPASLLVIDDRTVLHMLQAVQYVTVKGERRALSFRALNVEQIGYVYEGLLSFDGLRATKTVVGLVGRRGQEAEVPLDELERLAAPFGIGARADAGTPDPAGFAKELSAAFKDSGIGSPKALEKRLAPLSEAEHAEAERQLLSACDGDRELTDRLMPFHGCGPARGLLRADLRGLPVVILPGALYVTDSALRKNTGTHYTPPHLAEQVVEGALEPLVYEHGPLVTGDREQWKLKSADEILELKVVDIAMGSGAFLVAACRYLADRLVEARGGCGAAAPEQGAPAAASGPVDAEADETVIAARREVIEHCLYGADINPLAVEMAKLSLWLVSMDPNQPFTFLDDRLVAGDSLLGIRNLAQLAVMDLDEVRGRRRHARAQVDFTSGTRELVQHLAQQREELGGIPSDTLRHLAEKREILAQVRHQSENSRLLADLVAGAELASHGDGALPAGEFLTHEMARQGWSIRRSDAPLSAAGLGRLVMEGRKGAVEEAREFAGKWLDTDSPDGGMQREPLHWPLEFPEVFARERGGFDAVVGNPPFLGGQKLTGALGEAYREYLVESLGRGRRGSADFVAYFVLRAHQLLSEAGQTGLIATNTLAQGDTREVGLDQIVADGTEIRQAVKSERWPSKSAMLEYCAVWTSVPELAPDAVRLLGVGEDATPVDGGIGASLSPRSRVSEWAERLEENAGVSFQGSNVLGLGFTLPEAEARAWIAEDERYADVLFPYLNGQDINTSPVQGTDRWVIDFRTWSEEKAKRYPRAYAKVLRDVKPERSANNNKSRREIWWRFTRPAVDLRDAIEELALERCIVITLVSKVVMPVMVPTGQVFSHMLAVFSSDDHGMLALLSSAPHYWWAIDRASTMKGDLRYTPSDVFETLVRPAPTSELRAAGTRLDTYRRELMLRRDIGLTTTYNLVHDPGCTDGDIVELRSIHRDIDLATVKAYGWDDLLGGERGLEHDFHPTDQGTRYTVGLVPRTEILDRLRELNHQKYADEVALGLHRKPKKHPDMPAPSVDFEAGELFPPDDTLF